MDKNSISAAKKYLYDLDVDWKNWKNAQQTAGHLLELVEQADKELHDFEATRTRLQGEIKALDKELADGHQRIKQAHDNRVAELKQEAEKHVLVVQELEKRQIAAKQKTDEAEKAAMAAVAKQQEREEELGMVEERIEQANKLLAQLTKIGA